MLAAQNGDTLSQYRVSKMLESGHGFAAKQEIAAWHWLEEAAKNGHVQALYDLGLRYFLGINGVSKSVIKAKVFFLEAAAREHPEAMYYLGHMHSIGIGFSQNNEVAARYFREASQRGSLRAKCALAFMHAHGQGCELNNEVSQQLYEEAAQGGHLGAQFGLACLSLSRSNYKDARIWLNLAAHNDVTPAQAVYAKFLADGPAEYRDKIQALMWCDVVLDTAEADSDSTLIVESIKERLVQIMPLWQRHEASRKAGCWLARRSEIPQTREIDWSIQVRLEMQYYESKKNK
jgi:TPR repeat protein